jgi:glycosyltransferase involved in cell wall biosynthesis
MRRVLIISHIYVDPANRGKLRALAARDLELTVGVPQRWKQPPPAGLDRVVETTWERASGVEIFPIPVRDLGETARYRFGRRALASLIRDKRPDLIQIEEEPTSAVARQVTRIAAGVGLNIPVVLFSGESVERRVPLSVRWRRRRILRQVRGAAAGSEAAAALLKRQASDRSPPLPIAVIPQLGVHVPGAPEHQPHEGLAIGCVGRLVPARGIDTLLEALAEIRGANWRLTVVGDGPDRERLEALASRLRLAARVRWSGALPPDHLTRLWPELDVLAVPSRRGEGTDPHGHVLVEAMAHEVVVVGSTAGLIPEVVGEAGVTVAPEDASSLAEALRRLGPAAARLPLAQAGRARAMKLFSDDAVAERTLVFWKEIL